MTLTTGVVRGVLLALLATLLAAPLAATGQPAGRAARIGFLGLTDAVAARAGVDAFRRGLLERGWVEGQNLVIEFRWAEGKPDRLRMLAAELVALKVDVIWAGADLAPRAAKDATRPSPSWRWGWPTRSRRDSFRAWRGPAAT